MNTHYAIDKHYTIHVHTAFKYIKHTLINMHIIMNISKKHIYPKSTILKSLLKNDYCSLIDNLP